MKCTLPTRDKNIVRYLDKNSIKVMLINGRVMVFKILSDPVDTLTIQVYLPTLHAEEEMDQIFELIEEV